MCDSGTVLNKPVTKTISRFCVYFDVLLFLSSSWRQRVPHDMALFLYYWHHPPYVIASDDATTAPQVTQIKRLPINGMFVSILSEVVTYCLNDANVTIRRLNNQMELYRHNWTSVPPTSSNIEIFMPVWSSKGDPLHFLSGLVTSSKFLRILDSPGSVHFYPQPNVPVGSDLYTVIIQGWPMLVLIMLGAAYSGIIIWLLVSDTFNISLKLSRKIQLNSPMT